MFTVQKIQTQLDHLVMAMDSKNDDSSDSDDQFTNLIMKCPIRHLE